MSHTPTPWFIDEDEITVRAGEWYVAEAHGGIDGDIESGIRNARRIVACVNACEGIPQCDMEEMTRIGAKFFDVLEFSNKQVLEIATLRRQRDSLMEVAIGLKTIIETAITDRDGKQFSSLGTRRGSFIFVSDPLKQAEQAIKECE